MATSSAIPVEQYLRTTYDPDMEYLDGQLVERHVGEYFHSRLQTLIVMVLYLAAGIPHIWVVDPYKRTLVEADQNGIRRPETQVLATPLVGEVDFAALFRQLDEPAE